MNVFSPKTSPHSNRCLVKLYCFPYVGTTFSIYKPWRKTLADGIELVPLELSGRGMRMDAPFYDSFPDAVEDLFPRIRESIGESPYAFFGHSMGGILAYELARKIQVSHLPPPVHLFLSGRGSPDHTPNTPDERTIYRASDAELKQKLGQLGGIAQELLEYQELLDQFLPLLRADFRLVGTYAPKTFRKKLQCAITVLHGNQDEFVTREQIHGWEAFTDKTCRFEYFNSGHFFLHEYEQRIIRLINQTLKDQTV